MSVNNTEVSAISNVGSQEYSKSKLNPLDKEKIREANKKMNQPSVADTIRKTSCWSEYQSYIGVGAFTLFASLSITIGVLIVCLTSPKKTDGTCQLTFKRSATRQIGYESNPRSLAVGDFNNDGYQDIVVANPGTDNIGIFLGYGNGTFTVQKTYSTGLMSSPYSVAVEDFNKDGHLDIVVANYGSNSIGVLFGYGNGQFASQMAVSLGSSRPMALVVGNFNEDNLLDIAVVNYGTATVAILAGYDDGSFQIETSYGMGYDSVPYSLAVGDFNNDTKLDIAVVNYGTSTLAILLADENEGFTIHQYLTGTGSQPCSVAIGDFNKDNRLDIVVANSGTSSVGIFLGDGSGNFTYIAAYSTGSYSSPQFVVVGDFNNDTNLDIVIANSGVNNVLLLKGDGSGSFSLITTQAIESNSNPSSIAISDFDNDHKLDIAITNSGVNNILILTAYDVYPETDQTMYQTGTNSVPVSVAVGDFNNDIYLDIVAANSESDNIAVFINLGNGTFESQQVYYTEKGSAEQFVCVGDFNNDHQVDIVVLMSGVNKLAILLGHGNGTFGNGKTYTTSTDFSPSSLAVGDMNKDSYLDIIIANDQTSYVGLLLGYGDGTFKNFTTYPTIDGFVPTFVGIGDFNGDNISDIVATDFNNGGIAILIGYGNGSFLLSMIISTGDDLPNCVAVGDFNNDHRLDIAYTSPTNAIVGVVLGSANGTFGSITKYSTGNGAFTTSVALDDFNNDTLLDIIVSNVFDHSISMFLGFGNGSFAAQNIFPTGATSYPYYLASGDFNNDKQSDIVVANWLSNNIGVLLVHNGASFAITTNYTTGSGPHPYSVTMADLNNDNQSEIVVANPGNDNMQILMGYNNGNFINKITYSTGFNSRPQFVTTGDFNNDKQPDIAVASSSNDAIDIFISHGNGTFDLETILSTGSGSSPSSIAVGDFNNDGWMDLVVANPDSDNIAVFISFDYLTFTNNTLYMSGRLPAPKFVVAGDFNNDHEWDIVIVNENSEEVRIYLGYGNRTFSKPISYSTGDPSSPESIAVGDFNNDHQLDIVVANSDANTIGVFLGYGNGSLASQIEYATGNSSAPVSVAIGDFNKDNNSDIVVANSGTDNIGVFIGFGNGTFATQVLYDISAGSGPVWVAVGDLNNDHILDIIVANTNASNFGIFFGNGDATFQDVVYLSTGVNSSPCSVAVGDFNRDGWMDIAVANQGTTAIAVFSNNGNGTSFTASQYRPSLASNFQSIFVADLNNDTKLDILVTGFGSEIGVVYILFGFGDGNFTVPTIYSTGTNESPTSIAICDFDNDGRLDLAVTNYFKSNLFLMFQYGSERFVTPWTFATGTGSKPSSVTVGDFNHDNYTDVAVANSGTNNIGILLGLGDGTLAPQKTYMTGNMSSPVSIVVGYINDDDRLDIAVANFNANNIGILFGYSNGGFTVITTYSTGSGSAPSSITMSDLNKDNYTDIVVVTAGTDKMLVFYGLDNGTFLDPNSYAIEYDARPQSVTVGDINNDNLLDIIVANYGADYVEVFLQTC